MVGGSDSKEHSCNAETQVRSLGQEDPLEGNGNPLQYSCLENPMDRGAGRATVQGVAESRTRWSDYYLSIYLEQGDSRDCFHIPFKSLPLYGTHSTARYFTCNSKEIFLLNILHSF